MGAEACKHYVSVSTRGISSFHSTLHCLSVEFLSLKPPDIETACLAVLEFKPPPPSLITVKISSVSNAVPAPAPTSIPGGRRTFLPQIRLRWHLQRSFHSPKMDTCLTYNTNPVPGKKRKKINQNWPPACPILLYFRSPGCVFQDAHQPTT